MFLFQNKVNEVKDIRLTEACDGAVLDVPEDVVEDLVKNGMSIKGL